MPGCQWRPITHKKNPRSASTCFCIYIKYCYWLIQESGSAHWKPSKSFSIHGTVNSCRYKVHCSGRAGGSSYGRGVSAGICCYDTEGSSAERRCRPDNSKRDRRAGRWPEPADTQRQDTVSPLDECECMCAKVLYLLFLELLKNDHLHVKSSYLFFF